VKLSRTAARRAVRRAFTLMEVLVVVAIIVVLAGIATVSFRYLADTKDSVAKVKMKKVESAITAYRLKYGQFPGAITDLTASDGTAEAYLQEEDIVDPWGNVFSIDSSSLNRAGVPKIISQGEPGRNRPIENWAQP
jgi:general secretion pathway protein G